jgi:hypothetical protein
MPDETAAVGENPVARFLDWLQTHWSVSLVKIAQRIGRSESTLRGWTHTGNMKLSDAIELARHLDAEARVRFASIVFPSLRISDPDNQFTAGGSLASVSFEMQRASLALSEAAVLAETDGRTDQEELRIILDRGERLRQQIDAVQQRASESYRRGIPGNTRRIFQSGRD